MRTKKMPAEVWSLVSALTELRAERQRDVKPPLSLQEELARQDRVAQRSRKEQEIMDRLRQLFPDKKDAVKHAEHRVRTTIRWRYRRGYSSLDIARKYGVSVEVARFLVGLPSGPERPGWPNGRKISVPS